MPTEKRQRQKAGRQARREAEQKAQKRRQNLRRIITIAVVALVVVGLSYLIFGNKHPSSKASTSTTPASTTTKPAPPGGSGDTAPSAVTTSADCPASFTATLNKPSWPSPPAMTIDTSKTYTATITTDIGPFTVQLDPKAAPKAVNSFVFLADHHFFDCIVFHRVIPTFVDQTGSPTGGGNGGPGYQFGDELPKTASPQYPIGSVAMANSGPNTNGSQFFIVAGAQGSSLTPNYTLFGKVTSGMPVVLTINAAGSHQRDPHHPPPHGVGHHRHLLTLRPSEPTRPDQ